MLLRAGSSVVAFAPPWEKKTWPGMIQIIILAIVAVWLTWGMVNVVSGIAQIFLGLACGLAAFVLYMLAVALELIFSIFPNRKGSI